MEQNRLEVQALLEELFESENVYYQSPATVHMSYPAIRFNRSTITSDYANNKKYKNMTRYEVIVISQTHNHPVIGKLMELPYCSYDRCYVSDNLYHDVLTLYH